MKQPTQDEIEEKAENALKSYGEKFSEITKRFAYNLLRNALRDAAAYAKEFGDT